MADLTNKAPLEKVIATTSSKVKEIPIGKGQILFIKDQSRIALDFNGKRTFYNQITELDTEYDRQNLSEPSYGYYFIIQTATLWCYKESWIQITDKPSEVIFIGVELPELGQENKLYVNKAEKYISVWDEDINNYIIVADSCEEATDEDILALFK